MDPEHELNTPVPPVDGEHVNLSNEIEKELSKAESLDQVLDLVARFKEEFLGPSIASSLLSVHSFSKNLPPAELESSVHQNAHFQELLALVDSSQTFDAFTLMQVLDSLAKLRVNDQRLLASTSARMAALVKSMDSRHLLKLLQRTCKTQQMPTTDILAVLSQRADEIKEVSHPETWEDIKRALSKLEALLSKPQSEAGGKPQPGDMSSTVTSA